MPADPDLDAMIEELTRRTIAAQARARIDGRGSAAEMDTFHYRGALACLLNLKGWPRPLVVQPAAAPAIAPVPHADEASEG